jgi:hypothetical protein
MIPRPIDVRGIEFDLLLARFVESDGDNRDRRLQNAVGKKDGVFTVKVDLVGRSVMRAGRVE